jgi:hypothetical protein
MTVAINASLVRVRGDATLDDYGDASGNGPLKWHGEAGCMIRERIMSVANAGSLNRFKQTDVWVPANLVADDDSFLVIDQDDVITIRVGETERTYKVLEVAQPGEYPFSSSPNARIAVEAA